MNLFQLVLKQMRQRSLSTALTLLSVLLGVSLAIAILIVQRESRSMFGQSDFGYDIIVGPPKGSPLQLTLNTVYHMDQSPGVIPFALYEDLSRRTPPPPGRADYRSSVKLAVPIMVGDSFSGRRIIGTSPRMFNADDNGAPLAAEGYTPFYYRPDQAYEFAQGRAFAARKFEVVVGSEAAAALNLRLYDPKLSEAENETRGGALRATHGMPAAGEKPDVHKPRWRVVGLLKPTRTANDRVLFVPFVSLYAIEEHEGGIIDQALMRAGINPNRIPANRVDEALSHLGIDPNRVPESVRRKFKLDRAAAPDKGGSIGDLMQDAATRPAKKDDHDHNHAHDEAADAYHLDPDGNIVPDLPPDQWTISAVLVKSREGLGAMGLMYNFRVIDDRATAVNPALVMREFFETFLSGSTKVLLLISGLVTIVAGASILTTIYNSVSAR
ncbi:MAG TPA: ABC transporter permease, partial [Tepidisphaeraceae bacterium]